MKALLAMTLTLLMNVSWAETYNFKVTTLEPAKSFYRESPKGAQIGSEIKTFLASADIYKVRRDQWIYLEIESTSGKLKGIGMEFQDGYDTKHIPANKIAERKGGKYLEYSSKKGASRSDIQKQLKKFLESKKLKLKGEIMYLLLPAIKTDDNDVTQTFMPLE